MLNDYLSGFFPLGKKPHIVIFIVWLNKIETIFLYRYFDTKQMIIWMGKIIVQLILLRY